MTYRGINFNGYYGSAYGCQYWCNFYPNNWWLADRLLVLVYVPNPQPENDLDICLRVYNAGLGNPPYNDVLRYQPDASKYCIIDLTEIVRTYPPASHLIEITYGQGNEQQDSWDTILNQAAKGLINPAGVIIPEHALQDDSVMVLPPQMLYRGKICFEWRANTGWYVEEIAEDMTHDEFSLTSSYHELEGGADIIELYLYKGNTGHLIKLRDLDCEKKYALVEWRSFSGSYRAHVFEVRKAKSATANSYSLLNLAGEFTEIKGREDTFTLYLDGLNAYDMWYYADVMQSSSVRVSLDGGTTFRQVSVVTKGVTIPDTNIFDNKLEIDIKFRDYDAVIL